MNKNKQIIFSTKHQPPRDSHLRPFYTFDTLLNSSSFFCFVFKFYTKSSPPQSSFLFHHSTKSLSLCLFCFLSFFPPPLFLSLRTGSLQHTQVIVLFGGPQFEEACCAVVKFEGSTLGSHGAGEHCHYCVEMSRIVAVTLKSPCGSWPRRTCTRAGATASRSTSASLGLLQPLDLGTAQRQLVEELFRLWTGNPVWQVCYLKYTTHHWAKKKQEDSKRAIRC